ncbi:MAG: hypothetical protein AAGF11_15920 [Myxococcota bacterium]
MDPPVTSAMTQAVTTTPPGSATDGPLDTGLVDTGETRLDFPDYCSIFAQDCPAGYKCAPYANDGGGAWNDARCVPIVDDPQAPTEPCMVEDTSPTGIDNCDGSSMCWDVDLETLEGTCVPFCIGSAAEPACADPCERCATDSSGFIALCLPTCDPVAQNCAEGEGCYPIDDYFACGPDASAPGTTVGSPCEFINGCPPGLVCVPSSGMPACEAVGCCTPTCAVGGFDPCPKLMPGTVCTPWYGEPPPPERCLVSEPGVCASP